MAEREPRQEAKPEFRHKALIYRGGQGFIDGSLSFIREGLETDEPTVVMVAPAKIDMLRQALNGDGDGVLFADMTEVGANPARIIPAWRQFVAEHADRGASLRGIGEPVSAGLSAAELVENQRHESLVNIALADAGGFQLLCPYDIEALAPEVIEEAARSHPHLVEDSAEIESQTYAGIQAFAAPFDDPLSDPPAAAPEISFAAVTLFELRAFILSRGGDAGFGGVTLEGFVTAVNEVATNSVLYGGGGGAARLWHEDEVLICDVRDRGQFRQPLAGRSRPEAHEVDGRGLWLANQLCDLIQIRSLPDGTLTRVHVHQRD